MTRRVLVVLAVPLLVLTLPGCKVMQRISEGAYQHAVADGTTSRLQERGIRLTGPPSCSMTPTGSDALLRVHCTARTSGGAPVVVTGTATHADTTGPRELYVVTVGGREVLRTHCMGPDCEPS